VTSATLTAATLKRREKAVTLTWTVAGDMPTLGTWLLSTTLVGGENGPVHQFGVKFLDGNFIAAFIFDHVKAYQHNFIEVSPTRVGDKWTAVFPVVEAEVASSGRWTATPNLDGDDVDSIDGAV
jgi:hypothetical protein